ncbi:hypothetical protein ABIC86_002480 [Paenibacillus sp. DS2363]|uniref:hypothetical protein n=1 Tax=Paenibacillus sp. DS2363 TaxID=3156427 RepID=UPI0033980994
MSELLLTKTSAVGRTELLIDCESEDKLFGAAKELSIRVSDGSDDIAHALNRIDLGHLRGRAIIELGGTHLVQDILKKLDRIEDILDRDVIGYALFGTLYEDLN